MMRIPNVSIQLHSETPPLGKQNMFQNGGRSKIEEDAQSLNKGVCKGGVDSTVG